MIRSVQLNINEANMGKLEQLERLMSEALRVIQAFVDALWAAGDFSSKFSVLKTETWLSARMQQCLGKQALEVVKSQRKRKVKTRPLVGRPTLNLDQRFVDFEEDENTFDIWIRLSSLGAGLILKLPSKKHKHFNKYRSRGWLMRRGCRLRKVGSGWFVDVYFEKDVPAKKASGSSIGIDIGYKKLIACSDGRVDGRELESVYEKIARKRQGSKAFDRALKERDNTVGRVLNRCDLSGAKTVVVEALKNVKRGKKRMWKSFRRKLDRWVYPRVLGKLGRMCEECGIEFIEVNPAYTSQTCSQCGHVDKSSRKGERFVCVACGMEVDADINASRNILHRGVYSPSATKEALL